MQVKDIILNMSFWKNWKLTAYSKDFVKKGHLWIFALVSQLNCSRSITGTSASTLLPVDSSSPTPRLAHPKHWAAILFIAPPKLKTSCQWLFMGDGTSTSSQHCTPGAPSATFISTFWCPCATSRCASPRKVPSVRAQSHNSSSLLSLEYYFPILPSGNSLHR